VDCFPRLFSGNSSTGSHERAADDPTTPQHLKPGHQIFIGVVSPIDSRIENPKEIRDRILEATRYIPGEQLGTTDHCGFSPFCDDTSTTREKAFAKIR
jgi:5-methyltetrahydropteroyltriglutamate--homocysteine methyltransferase